MPASRQAPAVPVAPAVAPKPVARASPPPVAATARVAPVGSAANPAGTPASPATAPKPPVPKGWSSYPKLKTPEPAGAAQGPSVSLPHNGRWSLSGCDVRGRATSLPGRERTEQVAVVLEFEGLLNSEAGPELEQLLRGMLQAGFYWLVLHLQNLEFMASSCYGAIFGVSQELYLRGGAIAVCHAQPGIQRAIKTLALEEFVRVCEDESSALQALVKR